MKPPKACRGGVATELGIKMVAMCSPTVPAPTPNQACRPMDIILTREELKHLELLAEADSNGLTISAPTPRGGLQRLVDAGYVTDRAISLDTVL
jgi:hypothetical protein